MNDFELEQARQFMKQKELLKTPQGQAAYEYAKRKNEEEKRRAEILKRFELGYIRPLPERFKKRKTAEEMHREEILKNFQ